MEFPKFLLGDNTEIIQRRYLWYIQNTQDSINLENDEVEWFRRFL